MKKTRLVFGGLSEVVGGDGMAIVVLLDEDGQRAISLVCDSAIKYQIGLRVSGNAACRRLLPEVMSSMLGMEVDMSRYEIDIYNLVDGEYKVVVHDSETLIEYPIRLSDAVLLSLVGNVKIFIAKWLFAKQSVSYASGTNKLAIPINTLDTARLDDELKKAVKDENYRLASQIQEELKRRKCSLQ